MGDRLRSLWNFDDLDASEASLQAQLEREVSDAGYAEVLTQLARVRVFQRNFAACDQLLDEAAERGGSCQVVQARVDLERGRRLRLDREVDASMPLFENAFTTALAAGEEFIAVDAAHMAAIAASDEEGLVTWTTRGVELAESTEDPEVKNWLGT